MGTRALVRLISGNFKIFKISQFDLLNMLKSGPEPRPHARRACGCALAARTQYGALELFFGPIWLWVGVAPSGGAGSKFFEL